MTRDNGTKAVRKGRKRVPEQVHGATARPGATTYNERGFLPLFTQPGARKRVIGAARADHYGGD